MAERMTFTVNGRPQTITVDDPDMPLLYALRNDMGVTDTHFGCGLAQCGACTVHVDGEPIRSCVTPVADVKGKNITTIAGLGTPEKPHPLQAALIEEQAPQCGYCLSGWMMTAATFLQKTRRPSDKQIREALAGLKCRCGTHMAIHRAVKRAAKMMG